MYTAIQDWRVASASFRRMPLQTSSRRRVPYKRLGMWSVSCDPQNPWSSNFKRLVLFCIKADFCNQILILQHFSGSTRFANLCTALNWRFQSKIVKHFAKNSLALRDRVSICFSRFREIVHPRFAKHRLKALTSISKLIFGWNFHGISPELR